MWEPTGLYFTEDPLALQGSVAFLFAGQGSQYPEMLRDLVTHFAEMRRALRLADRALAPQFPEPLSRYIFAPGTQSEEERRARAITLTQTNIAQPALGAIEIGILELLKELGLRPDMVAGHSYGEYVALCAAGAYDAETLFKLSEARGRIIAQATGDELGAMAAVRSGPEGIADVVDSADGVWMSNLNAPNQTVISGTRAGIEEVVTRLRAQGIRAVVLPVSYGSHSPLMAAAQVRLGEFLSSIRFDAAQIDVYSNTLAAPYPCDPAAVPALLAEHLARPVEFVRQIDAMYHAGARIFVEIGPRDVVTGLTRRILDGRAYLAVPTDARGHSSLLQLLHLLAQLAAHGVPMILDRLYEGRPARRLDLSASADDGAE
jgi:acyl transferase domain-containing protein